MPNSIIIHKKEAISSLVVIVVLALLVVGTVSTNHKQSSSTLASSMSSSTSTASTSKTTATTAAATYKDGTYMANGSYDSPGGTETIAVSITLAGNKVTDATVKSVSPDTEAEYYQNQFISGFKTMVVGKPISGIKLSRVSGSSLTSMGFNKALQQIEKQAV